MGQVKLGYKTKQVAISDRNSQLDSCNSILFTAKSSGSVLKLDHIFVSRVMVYPIVMKLQVAV